MPRKNKGDEETQQQQEQEQEQGRRQDVVVAAIDGLFHLESMFENHGYEQGLRDGAAAGFEEGRLMGLAQGRAVGEEVGFYEGLAEHLLKQAEENPDTHSQRSVKMIQGFLQQASEFPRENNKEIDMITLLDRLRAKYRAVCSVLKLPHERFVPTSTGDTGVTSSSVDGARNPPAQPLSF